MLVPGGSINPVTGIRGCTACGIGQVGPSGVRSAVADEQSGPQKAVTGVPPHGPSDLGVGWRTALACHIHHRCHHSPAAMSCSISSLRPWEMSAVAESVYFTQRPQACICGRLVVSR